MECGLDYSITLYVTLNFPGKTLVPDMPLSPKQRHHLRGLAHSLKPVIIIGQHGLTPNVTHEIDQALTSHELIKLRVNAEDRVQRREIIATIVAGANAELVTSIGHIAVLYRPNPKKRKIHPGQP
jgi:RNA-binding protein